MKAKNPKITELFSKLLLKWNQEKNTRQMPWKGEKDPYKIWLSEIILQQTRVEQGLSYYKNFIRNFPDVHKLAAASESSVFKLWEGLGYYSRCRNLIASAKFISTECKGVFPDTYESIRALKGVGPYTAAAIASFAYNLPYAVLDGNVFRVLARVFGSNITIDSSEGKKHFAGLAEKLLNKNKPGIYNQAIMDFGAVICKPVSPGCSTCVFNKHCVAFLTNKVNELPVKEKKTQVRKRWFFYLVMEYKNRVAVRQRTGKDIWQGLHDFPMIETGNESTPEEIIKKAIKNKWLQEGGYTIAALSGIYKQQLSHRFIAGRFINIHCRKKPVLPQEFTWLEKKEINKYAFPQLINQFLKKELKQQALF